MPYLQKLVQRARRSASERLLLPLQSRQWGEFNDPFTNSIYVPPEWPYSGKNKLRPAPLPAADENTAHKIPSSRAVRGNPSENKNELTSSTTGYEPLARKAGQKQYDTETVRRRAITEIEARQQESALQPGPDTRDAPLIRRSIDRIFQARGTQHHRWGKPPAVPETEIPVGTTHNETAGPHYQKSLLTPVAPAPTRDLSGAANTPVAGARRKAARPAAPPATVRIGRLTVDVVPVNDKPAKQPGTVRKSSGKKNRQRDSKLRSVASSAFGIGQM